MRQKKVQKCRNENEKGKSTIYRNDIEKKNSTKIGTTMRNKNVQYGKENERKIRK